MCALLSILRKNFIRPRNAGIVVILGFAGIVRPLSTVGSVDLVFSVFLKTSCIKVLISLRAALLKEGATLPKVEAIFTLIEAETCPKESIGYRKNGACSATFTFRRYRTACLTTWYIFSYCTCRRTGYYT